MLTQMGLHNVKLDVLMIFFSCIMWYFRIPVFVLFPPLVITLMCFNCVLLTFPSVFKSVWSLLCLIVMLTNVFFYICGSWFYFCFLFLFFGVFLLDCQMILTSTTSLLVSQSCIWILQKCIRCYAMKRVQHGQAFLTSWHDKPKSKIMTNI